ncbi:MAG: hypothetical protein CMJ42_20685 [Phyllobacteriaceae bacterium]|nr:hypothetical protein [Phyllobacteriaceae bacterium]MBA90752.1 hypothetical protein [Phyllobacteriaceae bacterium]
MSCCHRQTGAGVDIFVRLTPRAAHDAVDGLGAASDGSVHLKARVRAVPEKGKANAALEKLVAKWLGVPVSTVSVTGGATARLKTVSVAGDSAALTRKVVDLTGEN